MGRACSRGAVGRVPAGRPRRRCPRRPRNLRSNSGLRSLVPPPQPPDGGSGPSSPSGGGLCSGNAARLLLVDQAGPAEVLAERRQVDAAADHLGEPHRVHRLEHVGLRLDDLVLQRVAQRLPGEPDQAEPEQVVEVRRHLVEVAAAGARADHVQPGRDQVAADHADRPAGPDVDAGLRARARAAAAGSGPRRAPAARGSARTPGGPGRCSTRRGTSRAARGRARASVLGASRPLTTWPLTTGGWLDEAARATHRRTAAPWPSAPRTRPTGPAR